MLKIANRVKLTISPETIALNPFLRGPFASNDKEYVADSDSLRVIGEIPKDLHGMFVRNTHNQIHEPLGAYHPFDGDGMLHAILFENGKATYRNSFVRTTGLYAEAAAGRSLWPGMMQPHLASRRGWGAMGAMKDNAGTDIACHAGKLLASMSQGSEPWRLDPITLETIGPDAAWAQRIPDGIASHYKIDVRTGEMMFFNYPEKPPYMNYGVIDRNNKLVHYVPIDLPGARWPHDLGITQRYTVLHDLPLYFEPEALKRGEHNLVYNRDKPARFGVIPRHGDNSRIRWFEAETCYILHITNCFDDGDEVVMDGCIMPGFKPPPVNAGADIYDRIRANLDKHNNKTFMHRWRFNMKTGRTREERIDDEITEFPVCNNDYVGQPYRYSYNVLYKKGDWLFSGLKRYDMKTGAMARYEYGEGRYGSEPQVGLVNDAKAEDDGYVVTMIADMNNDTSEIMLLRADDLAAGPVARIVLPERMNIGTHACWVEGDRLSGENRKLV